MERRSIWQNGNVEEGLNPEFVAQLHEHRTARYNWFRQTHGIEEGDTIVVTDYAGASLCGRFELALGGDMLVGGKTANRYTASYKKIDV